MRGQLRDDDGFSLIELLVAMSVGMLVVLAAFSVLDMSISTQSSATDRIETVQRGRSTMNETSRVIRSHTCLGDTKPGIVEATGTSLRLHSAVGPERLVPGFQRIHDRRLVYDGSARTLTLQQFDGTDASTPRSVTFSGAVSSSRVIGQHIRLDGAIPLFRYYTFQGTPATATLPLDPGGGALSETDRQRIVRIEVRFLVRTRDSAASTKYSLFTNSFWIRTADPNATSSGGGCQ
jgi:hypothetical protein